MENFEEQVKTLVGKLTKEDREIIVRLIGHLGNCFIMDRLKPKSEARIGSVCLFVDYLQNLLDNKNPMQRAMDILNDAFKTKTNV